MAQLACSQGIESGVLPGFLFLVGKWQQFQFVQRIAAQRRQRVIAFGGAGQRQNLVFQLFGRGHADSSSPVSQP
jgi:hypothetical protein